MAPITQSGCIPPERVILKSREASRLPCTGTSPIKDSGESFIQPYGWKRSCPTQPYGWIMSDWKSVPVDFLLTETSIVNEATHSS